MTQTTAASSWQDDAEVGVWSKLPSSPILWGGIATTLFYFLIPYSPIWKAEITRYFAGHWIEYVTSGLSFVGLAILAKKALRLASESQASRWAGWTGSDSMPLHDSVATAKQVERNAQSAPAAWHSTHIARRIREVCSFILGRRSATGLEEHLRYLGELAAGDLHSSYSLVRTVTWAVPILGFLGTVVGITDAIAHLTPEQMETSLDSVTSGLGTAFDTTALSLGWSMVIVFTTLFIERKEQALLADVEEFGTRRLAPLFADSDQLGTQLLAAEGEAAEQLLRKTETLITWQTSAWQESLDALRQRWTATLEQQQAQLEQALQTALSQSLAQHDQQLADARTELLSDVQQLATKIHHAAETSQSGLQAALAAMQSLSGELQAQGLILLRLADQEAGLQRSQDVLTANLQAVRQSATFEETLHTLNAAVHLLTNRVQARAA